MLPSLVILKAEYKSCIVNETSTTVGKPSLVHNEFDPPLVHVNEEINAKSLVINPGTSQRTKKGETF